MRAIIRKPLGRRNGTENSAHVVNNQTVSRAGLATSGMKAGDTRHRPTAAEHDLAARLGVEAYDSERGHL